MMIYGRSIFLAIALLLGLSLSAEAQGNYPSGVRSGYGGTAAATSPASSAQTSPPSSVSSTNRNGIGTGQGRSEGALGMSPQLQRELGIAKQQ